MKLMMSDRPLFFPQGTFDDEWRLIDLSAFNIHRCTGCFGCWVKTPGKCVIRDDAVKIYPCIAQSDLVVYISRICYGGYDVPMKTMLERAIPVQMAFIRLVNGETHHVQRAVVPKKALIVAYGADTEEEEEVFRHLVARNAKNMNFAQYKICFVRDEQVEEIVRKELAVWKKL